MCTKPFINQILFASFFLNYFYPQIKEVNMIVIQLIIVIGCILIGARIGGIGLAVMGGIGLTLLTFGFGLEPTSPPIDVMLMIMAVVAAASCMQAAGGLDYLVKIAEKILRKNPKQITFIAPFVTFIFTMFAGTGHVAYSVLPVIAEVSRKTGVRPERPLSMAVIASQFAIVASPISAAVVAMVVYLSHAQIELTQVLSITIPSTFLGLGLAAFITNFLGKELKDDPEYQRRLKDPVYKAALLDKTDGKSIVGDIKPGAKLSVLFFLFGAISVVFLGAFEGLRPSFNMDDGSVVAMGMAHTIEIIMLTVGALIILVCKVDSQKVTSGSVFNAGMRAVIAIFGIAWMGDTFFSGHGEFLESSVSSLVSAAPWAFAIALFIMSMMLNSQGATAAILMPLGVALGLPVASLIAMFPAVNGYFFVPNYGPIIAAIDFDQTGTTKIGKYVFNHSFMLPGLMSMVFSVTIGFFIANLVL